MQPLQTLLLLVAVSFASIQLSAATPLPVKSVGKAAIYSTAPTPSLPLTGGPTELPIPLRNLTLKHVAIGSGVQNYTCECTSSKPNAVGAVATLYDATTIFYTCPTTPYTITPLVVSQSLNSALIYNNPLLIPNIGSFPIIGSHYFAADGTPVFDLTTVREILFAKKVANIPAPKDASLGPAETGAVDWLALVDDGTGRSVGLGEVYRVETAGGSPPTSCESQHPGAVFSVQYAAEYWFFA